MRSAKEWVEVFAGEPINAAGLSYAETRVIAQRSLLANIERMQRDAWQAACARTCAVLGKLPETVEQLEELAFPGDRR